MTSKETLAAQPTSIERARNPLHHLLTSALVGAIVMTWVSPWFIKVLFTPPVSFGTNCEPAAVWSMSKLIYSQAAGLIGGPIAGYALRAVWLRRKARRAITASTPA